MPASWWTAKEDDEYELCEFESITLAYEVDLKFVTEDSFNSEVEQVVQEYFVTKGGRTTAVKVTMETTTTTTGSGLKHLILDLNSMFISSSDISSI